MLFRSNLGRFYLVHNRPLDLTALQTGMRGRFTKGSLEALLPGAAVFDSHKTFAERYRQALGVEDEKAFNLLRILQTGKGLGGTVNDFFRTNVLDTPRTLTAAEEAVEDFSHLRSIRRQLERARQQRDHLQSVPELNTRYRQAADALAHNRALTAEGLPAYRQRLALEGASRTAEKLEQEAAAARAELSAAEARRATLKDQRDALSARYAEEGGGAIATLERELAAAAAQLRSRETVENAFREELAADRKSTRLNSSHWE